MFCYREGDLISIPQDTWLFNEESLHNSLLFPKKVVDVPSIACVISSEKDGNLLKVFIKMIDILAIFITFFAVIDPIGTIPVFIAVTAQYDRKTKRRVALLATIVAACVLLFFLIVGEIVLNALSIPLPAFQISGGIVLFLFALNMIFGDGKPNEEIKLLQDSHKETAIFPLAVPSIASPGAMLAAVLLTKNWT